MVTYTYIYNTSIIQVLINNTALYSVINEIKNIWITNISNTVHYIFIIYNKLIFPNVDQPSTDVGNLQI